MWNIVNKLYHKFSPTNIKFLENDNITTEDPLTMANNFANFWSAESEDVNFPSLFISSKHNLDCRTNYQINPNAKKIESEITLIELNSALISSTGKTPGLDNVQYDMLKNLPFNAKKHLVSLYNEIFNSSNIPQSWKTATCIPINKPNKPKNRVEGYRPISLISCTSKVLEKIITKRLTWFLQRNKLISHQQVAFKPGKGTLDALVYLDHKMATTISTRNHISIISIDFEKAFDRIGIHTILSQLMEWKVGPKILNFIKSFLTNRKIRVKVNGTLSKIRSLNNGIPQGSPLSVVLFQIATEKLNKIIIDNRFFSHCIYADDLYLIAKITETSIFEREFQKTINEINQWNNLSGGKISLQKTKILHVCNKKICSMPNIYINNNEIQYVENLKILGIIFNKKYKWSSHVESLKTSLNHRLN